MGIGSSPKERACRGKALLASTLAITAVLLACSSKTETDATDEDCECSSSQDCPEPEHPCLERGCRGCTCHDSDQKVPGTPCPGGVCNGHYACVDCLVAADCPAAEACDYQSCVPAHILCDELCAHLSSCAGADPDCAVACAADLVDCAGHEITELRWCLEGAQSCEGVYACFVLWDCLSLGDPGGGG